MASIENASNSKNEVQRLENEYHQLIQSLRQTTQVKILDILLNDIDKLLFELVESAESPRPILMLRLVVSPRAIYIDSNSKIYVHHENIGPYPKVSPWTENDGIPTDIPRPFLWYANWFEQVQKIGNRNTDAHGLLQFYFIRRTVISGLGPNEFNCPVVNEMKRYLMIIANSKSFKRERNVRSEEKSILPATANDLQGLHFMDVFSSRADDGVEKDIEAMDHEETPNTGISLGHLDQESVIEINISKLEAKLPLHFASRLQKMGLPNASQMEHRRRNVMGLELGEFITGSGIEAQNHLIWAFLKPWHDTRYKPRVHVQIDGVDDAPDTLEKLLTSNGTKLNKHFLGTKHEQHLTALIK
ncbi:hypothetical protein K458DRAFT_382493 [Lentithecium fluviatile CBS 122367]|uniref:Uncharacterized protein n=1 Tax=Lentithecium fluviatile CBS 122367 TaxID=1168545 RepID=A0A6G1JL84_9PLEO|nr:hypothetical protein K458DRAFT_382493 [Lentithecium fluviatile CBS 122367]